MENKSIKLEDVLNKYGIPDPKIVGKLPKGGIHLDFVGHADTQKALTEIDPTWSMEPVTFDEYGLPAFRVENGMAHMGAWLTVHGVRRLGIGSVQASKPDLYKELLSDAIRNCCMRHNIYLSLWSKSEWDDVDHAPAPAPKPAARPAPAQAVAGGKAKPKTLTPLSDEQITQFEQACTAKGIDPKAVAANAGIPEGTPWMESHLPALRSAFKELAAFKDGQ
jgi:hypothetical protein